jgi:ribosomal protein S18 acetylase RimI-like enzyme
MAKDRQVELELATLEDDAIVLDLVRQYYELEAIPFDESFASLALTPLLQQSDAGRIWLMNLSGVTIGYVALCFGYSIELGGRDAFVDEIFILAEHRGKGIGKSVLLDIQSMARGLNVKALHLEVRRSNNRARNLYLSLGFSSRERFHLMTCRL